MWLLAIFLAIPLIEIALFIQVGGLIGVGPTIGLTILMVVLGLALVRRQGMATLDRLRVEIDAGRDPSGSMLNGSLLLLAGLLLVVPGFLTDALGLALLIPPLREAMTRHLRGRVRARSFVFGRRGAQPTRPAGRDTIEADYEVLDDVPPAQRGASGWTRPQS